MALLGEASRIFRMGCSAWVAGGIVVLESDRGSPSLLLSFFASLPYKVSIFLQIRSCYDVLSCHRSKRRLTGLGTSETLNQNKHFFLVRLISFGCLYRRQKADKHSLCMWLSKAVKRLLGPWHSSESMLGVEQEALKNGRKEIWSTVPCVNSLTGPLESMEGGGWRRENRFKEKANRPSMMANEKCPAARVVALSWGDGDNSHCWLMWGDFERQLSIVNGLCDL